MHSMSVTLEVSNFERSRESRDEHFSNIPATLVTLEVSNMDKSMDFSDAQPENMPYMFSTKLVLNEAGNAIEVRAEQSLNRKRMFVTLDVSNREISMLFSDEQPEKTPDISETDFMVRLFGSLIDSREEQSENRKPTAVA